MFPHQLSSLFFQQEPSIAIFLKMQASSISRSRDSCEIKAFPYIPPLANSPPTYPLLVIGEIAHHLLAFAR